MCRVYRTPIEYWTRSHRRTHTQTHTRARAPTHANARKQRNILLWHAVRRGSSSAVEHTSAAEVLWSYLARVSSWIWQLTFGFVCGANWRIVWASVQLTQLRRRRPKLLPSSQRRSPALLKGFWEALYKFLHAWKISLAFESSLFYSVW